MSDKKYTIDDLITMAKLGRFGNSDMNTLAMKAFVHAKNLQIENAALKNKLSAANENIQIFQVPPQTDEDGENKE